MVFIKVNQQCSLLLTLGDSLIYSVCKPRAFLYKITGRRQRPCIKNLEKSRNTFADEVLYKRLNRRIANEFSFTLFRIFEVTSLRCMLNNTHDTWFFLRGFFYQKVGNLAYPLQKINIVYHYQIGKKSYKLVTCGLQVLRVDVRSKQILILRCSWCFRCLSAFSSLTRLKKTSTRILLFFAALIHILLTKFKVELDLRVVYNFLGLAQAN